MNSKKILMGLTAVALSFSALTGAWAKPDKGGNWNKNRNSGNHGKTVSRTARDKDNDGYRNHGQKVSEVARSKNKGKYTRKYRTRRVYNNKTRRYENKRVWSYYDPNRKRWIRE